MTFRVGQNSGGGGSVGTAENAAPAHPWTAEDSMAASIVRLECENDELRARVAVLEEERRILTRKLNPHRSTDCDIAESVREKYDARHEEGDE